jgi:hypothetical protein
MFEFGQAYVALSRAVSLGGLHLQSYSKSHVKVHPKVINNVLWFWLLNIGDLFLGD